MEIVLELCECCDVYVADLNGDRLCPTCILAGAAPDPYWVPCVEEAWWMEGSG